eukprot:TRINITY_DN1623_c0_g1_i1.p1 TRINITY_DN1623_c0_g1~~TRINITY_DN1623_c0_g1_i1.p1  ORF type:complete len:544 (+),score=133.02 TRINITY_DN1623_c0_g1_i1:207-1838(+)
MAERAPSPGVLYYPLCWGLRFVRACYFREVATFHTSQESRQEVAGQGPLILAISHGNGLHDFIVPATATPRPCSFLATLPLLGWLCGCCGCLMRRMLLIPLNRPMDHVKGIASNHQVFDAVERLLIGGGKVGVYPEGFPHSLPELQPLRTGVARIALGAAARRPGLPLSIVPVGLSYTGPHQWRSRVAVLYGEPILITASQADRFAAGNGTAVSEVMHAVWQGLHAVSAGAPTWHGRELLYLGARVVDAPQGSRGGGLARCSLLACHLSRAFAAIRKGQYAAAAENVLGSLEEYASMLVPSAGLDDDCVRLAGTTSTAWNLLAALANAVLALLLFALALPGCLIFLPVASAAWGIAHLIAAKQQGTLGSLKAVVTIILAPLMFTAYDALGVWLLCAVLALEGPACPWGWAAALFCGLPVWVYVSVLVWEAGQAAWVRCGRAAAYLAVGKHLQDLACDRADTRRLLLAVLRHHAATAERAPAEERALNALVPEALSMSPHAALEVVRAVAAGRESGKCAADSDPFLPKSVSLKSPLSQDCETVV